LLSRVRAVATTGDEAWFRLLGGMAAAIGSKGYAATTVGDVVRHARFSKRTFYEHFSSREDCFLALHDTATDGVIAAMDAAAGTEAGWEARLEAAIRTYLAQMATQPALARAFILEVQQAGERGYAHRRRNHRRFGELIATIAADARNRGEAVGPIDDSMLTALVGAIDELILEQIERGRAAELEAVLKPAMEVVRRTLRP
jgi:AcrR family transcriptional regulator